MVHITNGWERKYSPDAQTELTHREKGKSHRVFRRISDDNKELGTYISFADAVKTRGLRLRMTNGRAYRDRGRRSRDRTEISMIITRYTTGPAAFKLIDECCALYSTLRDEHFFRGVTLEVRFASLTYYLLKDAGFRLRPSTHHKIAGGSMGSNTKWAKKIATRFRNPTVFSQSNCVSDAEAIVSQLVSFADASEFRTIALALTNHVGNLKTALNERMTQNDIAATIWLASKLTHSNFKQSDIRKYGNASDYGMRTSIGHICQMLGIERKELRKNNHAYDAREIIGGIK
jgi:hypothetical protein